MPRNAWSTALLVSRSEVDCRPALSWEMCGTAATSKRGLRPEASKEDTMVCSARQVQPSAPWGPRVGASAARALLAFAQGLGTHQNYSKSR